MYPWLWHGPELLNTRLKVSREQWLIQGFHSRNVTSYWGLEVRDARVRVPGRVEWSSLDSHVSSQIRELPSLRQFSDSWTISGKAIHHKFTIHLFIIKTYTILKCILLSFISNKWKNQHFVQINMVWLWLVVICRDFMQPYNYPQGKFVFQRHFQRCKQTEPFGKQFEHFLSLQKLPLLHI